MSFWDGLVDGAKAVGGKVVDGLNAISPTHVIDNLTGDAIQAGPAGVLNSVSPTAIIDHAIGGYQSAPAGGSATGAALSAGLSGTPLAAATTAMQGNAAFDFVIQLPNRIADTLANVGAAADVTYDQGGGYGGLANIDSWNQAWNGYGQPGHLSFGTIYGEKIFGSNNELKQMNPFDAKQSQLVQADVHQNWYSDLFGASTDVAAGFILPIPRLGVASRLAKSLDLPTVEKVAEAFNAASKDGTLGDLKATPVRDTLKAHVMGENLSSTESVTAHLGQTMQKLDGITDNNTMMNRLAPYFQNADERLKAIMSNIMVESNKLADPLMRQHVRVNALLAGMGSQGARNELRLVAPLVAKQMETISTTPKLFPMIDDLNALRFDNGADIRPSAIIDAHYGNASDIAELDALKAQFTKDIASATAARGVTAAQRSLKPIFRTKSPVSNTYINNIDATRIQDLRGKATQNVASLTSQLKDAQAEVKAGTLDANATVRQATSKGAMTDAGAAAPTKAGRDAVAAFGPTADVADAHVGLGAAQQKVADLTTALEQAKADHSLIHSTPLNDPDAMAAWKSQMTASRSAAGDASMAQRWSEAEFRTHSARIAGSRAEQNALYSNLNSANEFLSDIWQVGTRDHMMVGGVAPTRLDSLKSAFRETVGESHLYSNTSSAISNVFAHYVPNGPQILNAIGTPRARGAIDLLEVDRGRLQVLESLKRSGVFAPEEIRAAGNKFISTPAGLRQNYVSQIETTMLTRVAQKHGMTLEQALAKTKTAQQVYGDGRMFMSKAADAATDNHTWLRGLDGEWNVHDTAIVKSHLADTAPFVDPGVFHHALRDLEGGMGAKFWSTVDHADKINTFTQRIWKHSVLIRPGLGVRAMLDTELRAMTLVGAATQMIEGANALRRISARRGLDPLLEWVTKQPRDRTVPSIMGEKGVSIDIGGGQKATMAAYAMDDRAARNAQHMVLTKSGNLSSSLVGTKNAVSDRLAIQANAWDRYKAGSEEWPKMYGEHSKVLLASPTVRHLIDDMSRPADTLTAEQRVREIFADPAVRSEYGSLALGQDVSKGDYVHTLTTEVQRMFPTPQIAKDVASGRIGRGKAGQAWIDRNFPPEARFDIPGPSSILAEKGPAHLAKTFMDHFYRVVLDAPDLWMARHPVYVKTYERTIQSEAKALLEKRRAEDPNAMFGAEDLRILDNRARTQASTLVRNTFFDSSRNVGATHYVSKIAPFFNAWEDAMMSWSRLVYDDPTRAVKLTGAYNSFGNASPYMTNHNGTTNQDDKLMSPLMVDGNGKAVRPGEATTTGKYIALPWDMPGGTKLRINLAALNSIAQGEVAWLPGFGPTAQVSTTVILADMIPEAKTLDLVNTDNWFAQQLLHSMYLGGEVPKHGTSDIIKSLEPSIIKNAVSDAWGDNLAANVGNYMNQRYIDSQKNGTPWGPTEQRKAYDDAINQGRTAALVHGLAQGFLGLAGKATTDGQFYVDQMHQLNALPSAELAKAGFRNAQDAFSAKFPEAGSLDWRLTVNETGINATVNAQKSASSQSRLINDHPELGWFIVGGDNVGGQFSQTAYGMQRNDTYGYGNLGRKTDDPGKVLIGALASQGWDQNTKFQAALAEATKTQALTPSEVSTVKAAFVQWNGQQNPEWLKAYNTRDVKLATFYSEADALAKSSPIKNRSDIKLYSQYRQIRQEVLDKFGIKSFAGSSDNTSGAKLVMTNIGAQMATQDIGFSQMWDRMLSAEVK